MVFEVATFVLGSDISSEDSGGSGMTLNTLVFLGGPGDGDGTGGGTSFDGSFALGVVLALLFASATFAFGSKASFDAPVKAGAVVFAFFLTGSGER